MHVRTGAPRRAVLSSSFRSANPALFSMTIASIPLVHKENTFAAAHLLHGPCRRTRVMAVINASNRNTARRRVVTTSLLKSARSRFRNATQNVRHAEPCRTCSNQIVFYKTYLRGKLSRDFYMMYKRCRNFAFFSRLQILRSFVWQKYCEATLLASLISSD